MSQLRFEVTRERPVTAKVCQAREGVANGFELFKLVVEVVQVAFIAEECAIAGGYIAHVELVGREDEVACEIVEAFEKRERHRRGEQRAEHRPVKVQMCRLRHVAQISVQSFGV